MCTQYRSIVRLQSLEAGRTRKWVGLHVRMTLLRVSAVPRFLRRYLTLASPSFRLAVFGHRLFLADLFSSWMPSRFSLSPAVIANMPCVVVPDVRGRQPRDAEEILRRDVAWVTYLRTSSGPWPRLRSEGRVL